MAKVKEITVSRGRTIGLPGYSSVKSDVSMTIELTDDDKYEEVYAGAWKTVEKQLHQSLKKYLDELGDEGPGKEWLRGEGGTK